MFKSSGSREQLVVFIALAIVFVIGVESACDPHCGSACVKYPGKCDKFCNASWGLDTSTNLCGRCQLQCAPTTVCNQFGPGKCDGLCIAEHCRQNGICIHVPHCIKCTNVTVMPCIECASGYILVNGECIKCDDHCAVPCTAEYTCPPGGCVDPGYASITVPGSALTACAPCDANCIGSCKVQGYGKCDDTCKSGYALDTSPTSYTCKACARNCTSACTTEGYGCCDATCATGFAWTLASSSPPCHVCADCAEHCTSGCSTEGKGCCDSSCETGFTWTAPTWSPTCHVCV